MSTTLKLSTLPAAINRQLVLKIAAVALSAVPLVLLILYNHAYAVNAPVWWTDLLVMPVAFEIRKGNPLPLHLIFAQVVEHNLVATRLFGAISIHLTDWNMRIDSLITIVVATLNVGLTFILFRRHRAEWAFLALIPISALVLSLRQEYNWVVGVHICSYVPATCLLIGLLLLERITYPRLIITGLLACFGTFSYLAALMIWPLIPLVMWGMGHRRWQHYALWFAMMIATLALMMGTGEYLSTDYASTGPRFTNIRFSLADLPRMFSFMTALLANSLTYGTSTYQRHEGMALYHGDYTLASVVSIVGVVLWLINVWFLYRSGFERGKLAIWVALGLNGIGVSAMITIGRLQTLNLVDVGMTHAVNFWYVPHALWFWVSLVVLILFNFAQGVALPRAFTFANTAALIAITVLYMRANAMALNVTMSDWGHGFGKSINAEVEECLYQYIFTHDASCLPQAVGYNFSRIDEFAVMKLGPFADRQPSSILSEPVTDETRVIIETTGYDTWLTLHIRDWLLGGVNPDQVYPVAPRLTYTLRNDLPQPIGEVATTHDPASVARLEAFLDDAPEFWYVQQLGMDQLFTTTDQLVKQIDTDLVYEVSQETVEVYDVPLAVTHFDSTAAPREVTHDLGSEMGAKLHGWSLRNDVQVQPCQSITVESWWSIQTPLMYHSVTLAIADANGVGITAQDGPPLDIGFELWHPDWVYRDVRTLTMPCDAASGEYLLLLSVYQLEPFVAGNPLYLTTLIVP